MSKEDKQESKEEEYEQNDGWVPSQNHYDNKINDGW
jgi:hypothetical protein